MASNIARTVNTEKILYVIGLFIFGGMLLSSIIDSSFYLEKYSSAKLIEFRLFIGGSAVIYYFLVFVLNRRKQTK